MEQTKSMSGLSKIEVVLLSLIADSLFGIPLYDKDNIDWDEVAKEALNQAVLPLAFNNIHCMALIDPAYAESIERKVEQEYLKAFPDLRGKYQFALCDSTDGVVL